MVLSYYFWILSPEIFENIIINDYEYEYSVAQRVTQEDGSFESVNFNRHKYFLFNFYYNVYKNANTVSHITYGANFLKLIMKSLELVAYK